MLLIPPQTSFTWALHYKSLGGFEFGCYLRLCHVVSAKKHPYINAFIPSHLLTSPSVGRLPFMHASENVKLIWEQYLSLVIGGSKGPFHKRSTDDVIDSLTQEACVLFPFGFPSENWTPDYSPIEKYNSFFSRIYRRTPPVPISSRWYTTESSCFYYYSIYLFGLLDNFLLHTIPRHWPGDNFRSIEDNAAYAEVVKNRIARLRTYVSSFNFVRDSVVGMVTSFPRWKFVQELERVEDKTLNRIVGVNSAVNSFLNESNLILSCQNLLAEQILAREDVSGLLRLDVYRGLLSSALYLAIKYHPYKSSFWQCVTSNSDPTRYIERSFDRKCCSETGTTVKIDRERSRLSKEKLEVSDGLLKTTISSMSSTCRKKGFTHGISQWRLALVGIPRKHSYF